MSNRINVSNTTLKWALRTGAPLNKTAEENVFSWIKGDKKPTFKQLEKLSNQLKIPFGYLLLDAPPEENIPLLNFRTETNKEIDQPSRYLIETIKECEQLQNIIHDRRKQSGINPLSFVGSVEDSDSIEQILEVMTKSFNGPIYKKTIKEIIEELSNLGVLIIRKRYFGKGNNVRLDSKEFRAFVLNDSYAPLIFLNEQDSSTGQYFSILHEMVHIWFNSPEIYNVDPNPLKDNSTHKAKEKNVNRIVSELSMPSDEINKRWEQAHGNSQSIRVQEVSKYFHTSDLSVAIKLNSLGKVSSDVVNELIKITKERISNKQETVKRKQMKICVYNKVVHRYTKSLVNEIVCSAYSGKINFLTAYDLLGVKGKGFNSIVERFK